MFVIGVTGFSCSGKTTLSDSLVKELGAEACLLLSMDDYYKELSEEQYKSLYDEAAVNFDTPEAVDLDLLASHLTSIVHNEPVTIPKFDLGSCVVTNHVRIQPGQYKYVIVEGVFILNNHKQLDSMFDLKIWVDASEYVCALRRFIKYTRDIKGYSADYIYNQCVKFVIPGQERYIKPVKPFCDLIHNGEKLDASYIDMLVYLIKKRANKAV